MVYRVPVLISKEQFRSVLTELNLSQADLARFLNLSDNTVRGWGDRSRVPPLAIEFLVKLVRRQGKAIDFLDEAYAYIVNARRHEGRYKLRTYLRMTRPPRRRGLVRKFLDELDAA